MERAGTTVPGSYRDDVLVRIAEAPGPFASVWLARAGLGAADATADAQANQVRRQLLEAGAPDDLAESLAAIAGRGAAAGVVAIADGSGVLLSDLLDEAPRRDVAQWAPFPAWSAAIEHRQAQIPVIVVLADRLGAEIMTSTADGEATTEVVGDDDPIRKVAPGGWSQRRFQQRAENTWEHNAGLVADEIANEAKSLHPQLVVLGGDVRAVQTIRERLPKELQSVTHTMTGGRAADGSDEQRVEDVDRLVRTAVAEQTVALLQSLAAEDGRDALAANGAVATFEALARSQVDVLLVHDDADDDRRAWWSPDAGTAALDRTTLEALGPGEAVEGRLVDVAVTAALRSGASVRVVPDAAAIREGIAALLRW